MIDFPSQLCDRQARHFSLSTNGGKDKAAATILSATECQSNGTGGQAQVGMGF
jgi:hypothetical protein